MLKKIDKIHQIGKFENFEWNQINEFKKINLLFGINGSGKTTISNIFNLISSKKIFEKEKKEELFKDLANSEDSKIQFTGKNRISYPDENPNYESIFVFNSNFVTDHVFDGSKSNLRKFDVSNTELQDPKINNINEKIESLETENKKIKVDIEKIEEDFKKLKKDYNGEFRKTFSNKNLSIGKDIPTKDQFESKNLEELKSELKNQLQALKFAKNQEKLNQDISSLQKINFKKLELREDTIRNVLNNTVQKISTNSLAQNIKSYQNLVEEEDTRKVEPWYKFGYKLLRFQEETNSPKCPLCDSDISDSFQNLLNSFSAYFDKEYDKFIESIKDETNQLEIILDSIKDAKDSYDDLLKIYIDYSQLISHISPNKN